jgi:hypothetical protein
MLSREPDYKEFIQPIHLRRMSRALKMGVTAAGICLRDAQVETPDAIITATGLGMMEDSEKFLTSMIDKGERLLNPTSFILSTHNTVGAYIAVMLKCNRYNFTYAHNFLSFESALTDAFMRLEDAPSECILIGGLEAIADIYFQITGSVGFWKKEPVESLKLLQYASPGTLAGEGVAFFLLTQKPDPGNYARIRDIRMIYKPGGLKEILDQIERFLVRNQLDAREIDLVLLGLNGDVEHDRIYRWLQENCFAHSSQAYFKHLCGEHYVASSFALWMAAKILKGQRIPPAALLQDRRTPGKPLRNVLIYNQNKNISHSLLLVSSC